MIFFRKHPETKQEYSASKENKIPAGDNMQQKLHAINVGQAKKNRRCKTRSSLLFAAVFYKQKNQIQSTNCSTFTPASSSNSSENLSG